MGSCMLCSSTSSIQLCICLNQLFPTFWITIDDKENEKKNEIKNKHANGATEAVNISATNAFAEEDTVMVIVIDTHLAIFTMFHIFVNVYIAFYTIQNFYFLSIFAFSVLPRWLIIFDILRFL